MRLRFSGNKSQAVSNVLCRVHVFCFGVQGGWNDTLQNGTAKLVPVIRIIGLRLFCCTASILVPQQFDFFVSGPPAINPDASAAIGQRAITDRVGDQFMQGKTDMRCAIGKEKHIRSAHDDAWIVSFNVP
jgi:hypothetical protein